MLNDSQQVNLYAKYSDFRANADNDEFTDAMFCGQNAVTVADLGHVKKRFPQIETDILSKRRARYAASLAQVDKALFDKAIKGDAKAADLIYRRFENWSPKVADENARVTSAGRNKTFAELIAEEKT